MAEKKITAGRDYLGAFAPQFAALNDDVLFGQVWSRTDKLPARDRSLVTIGVLMGAGILDTSLKGHLETARENGVTKAEIVEVITHAAFYAGWPKAWAAFAMAMEVYGEDVEFETQVPASESLVQGELIDDPKHFTGAVRVREIWGFERPVLVDSVTFEPGCINNWHIHQAGQTLIVTDGRGYYQEEGSPARELRAGDVVEIPAGVKHWHGASKDSTFTHIALEDPSKGAPTWLERVDSAVYDALA